MAGRDDFLEWLAKLLKGGDSGITQSSKAIEELDKVTKVTKEDLLGKFDETTKPGEFKTHKEKIISPEGETETIIGSHRPEGFSEMQKRTKKGPHAEDLSDTELRRRWLEEGHSNTKTLNEYSIEERGYGYPASSHGTSAVEAIKRGETAKIGVQNEKAMWNVLEGELYDIDKVRNPYKTPEAALADLYDDISEGMRYGIASDEQRLQMLERIKESMRNFDMSDYYNEAFLNSPATLSKTSSSTGITTSSTGTTVDQIRDMAKGSKEMLDEMGVDTSSVDFNILATSDDVAAVRAEAEKLKAITDEMGGGVGADKELLEKTLKANEPLILDDVATANKMIDDAKINGSQEEADAAKALLLQIRQEMMESLKTGIYNSPIKKRTLNAKGGRIGFESGGDGKGKLPMSRRGFLGTLAGGIASIFAPKFGKEIAEQVITKGTKEVIAAQGMPNWYPLLVNKIRDKGKITRESGYAEAKEEGINYVQYELKDDSLSGGSVKMTEDLNTGEISIWGRGDEAQQVELTFTPGDRTVKVETGQISEGSPSFNAEAGVKDPKLGWKENLDKHPITIKKDARFEADEFWKGEIHDVEVGGTLDDLKGGLETWENLVKTGTEKIDDATKVTEDFLKTQKKPVEPDMAKGGRVGLAYGGDLGTLEGVSSLLQDYPDLMSAYHTMYKGPSKKSLRLIDPSYNTHAGKNATHNIGQYLDLKSQWNQNMNDYITGIEAGYDWSPTEEQRSMLMSAIGAKNQYDNTFTGGTWGQDQKYELANKAYETKKALENWLPGQEGLFDALKPAEIEDTSRWRPQMEVDMDENYGEGLASINRWHPNRPGYEEAATGGRIGYAEGDRVREDYQPFTKEDLFHMTQKERAKWMEKLERMKRAKLFAMEEEKFFGLSDDALQELGIYDPTGILLDKSHNKKLDRMETKYLYDNYLQRMQLDAAGDIFDKKINDFEEDVLERQKPKLLEVAQGGRVGFQQGGASGVGGLISQINQMNNTIAQNSFGAGAQMGAQSAAGQINSSQPTLGAAVSQISNQINGLGQGIQQMIRPNQVGQQQLTSPQFNANQTQALAPPAGQVTNLDSLSPLTSQQFQAQFTPNIEGDMLSMPEQGIGNIGTMIQHKLNPTPESTQRENERQAFWAQQADISGQRQDAWQGHVDDWMGGIGDDFFGIDTGQYGNYVRDYRESEQFDQSAGGQGFVDWASQQHQQNQFVPNMGWERTPEAVAQIQEEQSNFTDFYNTINPTTGGMRTGDSFQQNRGMQHGRYDNRSRQYDQGFSGTFGDAMGTQDPMIPQQNIYNPTGAMNTQQNIYNPYGSSGVGRSPYLGGYRDGGLTRTVPPQRGPLANGIGTRFKEKQVWL